MKPENVRIFESAAQFRAWLLENHDTADYQWVGYPRKGSPATDQPSMTHAEAVHEALCFGWIDGLAGKDGDEFAVRFSKRRAGSVWSTVNVGRMRELLAAGRVAPAGMRAWEARREDRTSVYLSDMGVVELPPHLEAVFRANDAAWGFWNRQPAGYRRQMTWWVISAKRQDTQRRRLDVLVEEHAAGQRIDPVHRPRMSAR